MDLIKLKFLHNKGNHKQKEKIIHRMEKILANEVTNEGLISKIYKYLLQLNIKNKKQQKLKNG